MERKLLIIFYFLFAAIPSYTQCITSDSLWERLIYIRDSSTASSKENLRELLHYESLLGKCPVSDSSYALLMQRIGGTLNETGDFLQAEKYVQKAIRTITKANGRLPENESQLLRDYYLLYLIYDTLNRTNDKITSLDSCIAIGIRSASSDIRMIAALNSKTQYLIYTGDYHRTISYATEGQILTSKIVQSKERLAYLFNFLIWEVNSLILLEKYDEADKLLSQNMTKYTTGKLNDFKGIILERLAVVKTKKKQFKEAVDYFNRSLSYNKKTKNYFSSLITLTNMGFYLYDKALNNEVNALSCYRQALTFVNKILTQSQKDSVQVIIESLTIYDNIANIYNKRGEFDSAQFYFRKGFYQIQVTGGNKIFAAHLDREFLQNKSIPVVVNALIDQGDSYLNQFKKTGNLNILYDASLLYKSADKLQYVIKVEQTELQSQLFWRNYLRRLYEHAIETSFLKGDMNEVFYYFEKSRAVLMNDQLNKQLSLSNDDLLKLSLVKTKILGLNRTLSNLNPSTDEYKETQNELFTYNGDLNILDEQIQKHNPAYLRAIEDTNTIHLEDLRKSVLNDHDALIEVLDGDSSVYVLLITSKNIYLNKIGKPDYEKISNDFISFISNASFINSHYTEFVHTANRLYQLIFDKLPIPTGRIIISPDGRYFPFEALVTNSKTSAPEYFIQNHAVSYTYSARYLLYNFSINSSSSILKDFLGIAPVEFKNFGLAGLPGSVESLNKIGGLYYDVRYLTLSEATKESFLQNFSNYKIIQLYTHSSDSSVSGEPVIYFSDSTFFLSELIPEDKPSSQLIVLSACETGNGKLYLGEGVFSFNRGFAALGIPSTITNLWSVDNQSTYSITELFYKYISKGMPIDLALQKAKLEFISSSPKSKKLPYYWAAAILAGKTDAIETGSGFSWYWVAIGAGVILLCLAVFQIRRKKSTSPSRVLPGK